jgi:hypothetical protein
MMKVIEQGHPNNGVGCRLGFISILHKTAAEILLMEDDIRTIEKLSKTKEQRQR